jgi:class 3 adenylate cyclase/TolB-like protein/Tfp pilus assembly protein PilF
LRAIQVSREAEVPSPKAERRLAAIVAADVVDYSRLMGEDETQTLEALKAHRRELIDPLVADHNGHIVKTTGDGLLLEFPSAVEAVTCAVEVQRAMAERNRDVTPERRISLRVGINIGDVIVENGDVFGDGVNIAARLEQIAEPGAICLSEDAYRQIRGKLDVELADAGAHRLKNIADPVRIYRIRPASSASRMRRLTRQRIGAGRRFRLLAAAAAVILGAVAAVALWAGLGRAPLGQQQAETQARGALPIVAVLPFANQTGDKTQDYFADGVTEEVINALGRFKNLRVIGHSAVMPYKNRPATVAEIASELAAGYIVGGSVRRSERRVRISAQLTEVASATVLWTDRYDGELADIFELQDRIARDIAGTLAANITQLEGRRRLDEPKPNPTAFDLVLRARAIGHAASRPANRQFRELVTKAIELDPAYAAAHALLADAIYAQVILGWTEFADQELNRAEEHARRAIALAPNEPDGHRVLGRILLARAEYDQALNALARAIEINPSDATALAMWGTAQSFTGDISSAIEALELALKYDPMLEPNYVLDLTIAYYLARRHDDALRLAERSISRFSEFAAFNVMAAAAAAQLGRNEEAGRYAAEVRQQLPFFDRERFGSRYKEAAHQEYLKQGLRQAGL